VALDNYFGNTFSSVISKEGRVLWSKSLRMTILIFKSFRWNMLRGTIFSRVLFSIDEYQA